MFIQNLVLFFSKVLQAFAGEAATQESPSQPHVLLYRTIGDADYFGRFLHRETSKRAQIHNFGHPGKRFLQFIQGSPQV